MSNASQFLHKGLANGAGGSSQLQVVEVWSSQKIYEAFGVCQHPNFNTQPNPPTEYGNIHRFQTDIVNKIADANISYQRGGWNYGLQSTRDSITACRNRGVGWITNVISEVDLKRTPDSGWQAVLDNVRATIHQISTYASDVVIAIEGPNEPNHFDYASGDLPGINWKQRVLDCQSVMYEEVRNNAANANISGIELLGPSLHVIDLQNSNGQDILDFGTGAAYDINPYISKANLHSYSDGIRVTNKLLSRYEWTRQAFATKKIWMTEGAGWSECTGAGASLVANDQHSQAVYMQSAMFEIPKFSGGYIEKWCSYEMMNDYDPSRVNRQSNWGWIDTTTQLQEPSGWVDKEVYGTMATMLAQLKDVGTPYTPSPVLLRVSPVNTSITDVKYCVTAKRNGAARCWLWRDKEVWNVSTRTPITVNAEMVEVEDQVGTRTIPVDASMTYIDLR